ncbi:MULTISPECIES: protein phosphatase CheZ [Methylobacterium]|nr:MULTISPECIES: protein phosphatase CheZ [Methylobacterium]MBK3396333.1 protein phosphatase CheZ [Methylobacterium ajmalii]MBK3410327.1 protein phosphatase CheZ [Methylobacterium ajmalii]MBK3423238.1 protein phosphatase CheZ [Methylobacterium ajmalii]MBZ6411444.1 protein phosphatase CheZ [Methylobacterium sp.]SEP34655.1 chemotaxis protein CheZ [Methylobacterium sp. ap11]
MAGTTAAQAATPAIPVTELLEIADYITKLKGGIAALRAQELTRDRIPMAHDELGSVVAATASATNRIMESAESILALEAKSLDDYRRKVEAHIGDIFEACTFQDITGQRISKVVEALGQLEKRLSQFSTVVNVRDGEAELDPEEARRKARAEKLLLNGPQPKGPATPQDAIDALFS